MTLGWYLSLTLIEISFFAGDRTSGGRKPLNIYDIGINIYNMNINFNITARNRILHDWIMCLDTLFRFRSSVFSRNKAANMTMILSNRRFFKIIFKRKMLLGKSLNPSLYLYVLTAKPFSQVKFRDETTLL